MANPSLSLLKQNLLKGLNITPAQLGYIVEQLTNVVNTTATGVWPLQGSTTATGDITILGASHNLTLGTSGSETQYAAIEIASASFNSVQGGTITFNGESVALTTHTAGITFIPETDVTIIANTLGSSVLNYSTTSTGDDPKVTIYQQRVTTTDATVTTLHTVAIPTSTTVLIKGFIVARRTGGASGTAEDGAAYEFSAVYKNVAGTATLIGAAIITVVGESQAGWDVTLVVSTSNVQIRVTGAAANNITWHLSELKTMIVSS